MLDTSLRLHRVVLILGLLLGFRAVARADPPAPPKPQGFGLFEIKTLPDGSLATAPSYISPEDLTKLIKDNIPQYQSIAFLTNSCFSQVYVDSFTTGCPGDTVGIGPSTDKEKSTTVSNRDTGEKNSYFDQLIKSIKNNPNDGMQNHHQRAVNGDPFGPNGTGSDKNREHPQFKSNGNGAAVKFKNGTKSNHALIVNGLPTAADNKRVPELEGLTAGFDSSKTLNSIVGDFVNNGPNPNWATKDNLAKELKRLGTVMNKDEHLNIILIGHTTVAAQSQRTNSGNQNGAGERISPQLSHDSIQLEPSFTNYLLEDSVLDDPYTERFGEPYLYLRTADESFVPATGQVHVYLNDLFAGDLGLHNAAAGDYYTLPLSDSLLSGLTMNGIPSALDVRFEFTNPGASFQLTTEGDLLTRPEAGSGFGIGLAANITGQVEEVPEPISLTLAGSIVMLLGRWRFGAAVQKHRATAHI